MRRVYWLAYYVMVGVTYALALPVAVTAQVTLWLARRVEAYNPDR